MNNKKLIFIIVFVAVAVGFGYMLFRMFFAPSPEALPGEVPGEVVTPGAGLPTAPTAPVLPPELVEPGLPEVEVTPPSVGRPTEPTAPSVIAVVEPVVASPTAGASMSSNGSINFYNREDNKFYRMMPDGTMQKLTNKAFYNVTDATFNPRGDKAIVEYPDGSNIVYDFQTGQQTTLPKHWQDFDFNQSGDQIVAKSIGLDFNNRFVVISNTDGSQVRAVQELGDNADKVTVDWSPNGRYVALANTGDPCGPDCGGVFLIGQNKDGYNKLTIPGLDFRPAWAPDGNQLLFSVMNLESDWKPQLWIADVTPGNVGGNRRSFSVNTWADKCTFTNQTTVYCAVPRNVPTGAGLDQRSTYSGGDDIMKIDLTTGLQTIVAKPEGTITIDEIMVTPDKKSIYITNKTTGFLNRINISQ